MVKRNIVSLRHSEDLFDDLHGGDNALANIAINTEQSIKPDSPATVIDRGFHYSTAILYPFNTENWLQTRYSDGRHAAWYGSLELETTIWETGYHALKGELAISQGSRHVYRERSVYDVQCQGLLIDLTAKSDSHPDLVSDDYGLCQQIGRRVFSEGLPGLLATSVRFADGNNVIALKKDILSNAKQLCYLSYEIDTHEQRISVERTPGKKWMELDFSSTVFWN